MQRRALAGVRTGLLPQTPPHSEKPLSENQNKLPINSNLWCFEESEFPAQLYRINHGNARPADDGQNPSHYLQPLAAARERKWWWLGDLVKGEALWRM